MNVQEVNHLMLNMSPAGQIEFITKELPTFERLEYMKRLLTHGFSVKELIRHMQNKITHMNEEEDTPFSKKVLLKSKLKALEDIKLQNDINYNRAKTQREIAWAKGLTLGLIVLLLTIVF